MTTRKTPDAVTTGRAKAAKSSPTGKGQRRGITPAEERRSKALQKGSSLSSKKGPNPADSIYFVDGIGRPRTLSDLEYFPIESPAPDVDNVPKTGKTGAKDEGLVHEPQSKIRDAGVETAQRSVRQLSDRELSRFFAHAAANKWDSNSGVAPSAHIKSTFVKWLGRGLWREHIVKAQPNLANAYATEVSRDPSKRVEGLAVRPHKKPAGSPRPLSVRLVAELSEAERELRREAERTKKQRWREGVAKQNL
jgi:hypothetical protein